MILIDFYLRRKRLRIRLTILIPVMIPLNIAIPELKLFISALVPVAAVSFGRNNWTAVSVIRCLDARISANFSAFC